MNLHFNIQSIIPAFFLWLLNLSPSVEEIIPPPQKLSGPGGMEYLADSVHFQDFAEESDGYWLFEPIVDGLDSAEVVVFTHGYGAYNPMVYGDWIEHLVRKGNIVIFPRYQKSLMSPKPRFFVENTAKGIRDALVELDTGDHVKPILSSISLVGHSYGGVISANLAVNYDSLQIPRPDVVFLCAPGSGPFRGGVLDSYENMPADIDLLIMVSEDDRIVKDKLGKQIFSTAINTPRRNLIRQFPDDHGLPEINAGHNESYSLNLDYDAGFNNLTTKRAHRKSSRDAVDYFGYWKLFDALLDCSRSNSHCEYAFGDTEAQRYMGKWSDGQPVRELEVLTPETDMSQD